LTAGTLNSNPITSEGNSVTGIQLRPEEIFNKCSISQNMVFIFDPEDGGSTIL
jgi:hypothetical protein